MRIDAHHHLWTLSRGDYGWLTSELAPIYRDFGLADLAPHLAAAAIEGTILVQAAPTQDPTHATALRLIRPDGYVGIACSAKEHPKAEAYLKALAAS